MRKEYRRARLGVKNVEALKPNEWLWDTVVTGFRARRQRSPAISYEVFYRLAGRERWLTLGRHGPLTPHQARQQAQRVLGEVVKGNDPAGEKQTERGAATVAQLVEQFLSEHVEAKRKASSAASYRRILKTVVLPAIGNRKVAAVVREDIERLHNARRQNPTSANFMFAAL
jgi:hypothetical protein